MSFQIKTLVLKTRHFDEITISKIKSKIVSDVLRLLVSQEVFYSESSGFFDSITIHMHIIATVFKIKFIVKFRLLFTFCLLFKFFLGIFF